MVLSFSIVTPSLNQGRFIEQTIRSVLDQGYRPLEYIVCDGGSSDRTPQVLERYVSQVRVVSEPDRGQADAVNKGIRATSGDVIGWLNSDDLYLPEALRKVSEFMVAHPDVDLVYGDAQLIDAAGELVGIYYTEPWSPRRLVDRCILAQPAVFFRRRAVDRYGYLDDRLHLCMDYEYWLRLSAAGATFAYTPAPLAASRIYPETKSLAARLAVHHEINAMLRQRLGRVPDTWLINHAHTVVELDRANRANARFRVPYALAVVLQAGKLSLQWNHSLSPRLVALLAGPLAHGARRRLARSGSATTKRPAS